MAMVSHPNELQPSPVSEPEEKSSEHVIIEACIARLESNPCASVAGVHMDLYEFEEKINNAPNVGYLFQPASKDYIAFPVAKGPKRGCIKWKNQHKIPREVKFWTKDLSTWDKMKELVDRSMELKCNGILRLLLCTKIDKLSKVVVGSAYFDLSFEEWLGKYGHLAGGEGYLSNQVKDIVRTGLTTIDYFCERGLSCSDLDKVSSYVMDGTKIKILPFLIRLQLPEEKHERHKLTLRVKFADMLDQHVKSYCSDEEFDDLISLIKNEHASTEIILASPMMSTPAERQMMYRDACSTSMTEQQVQMLDMLVSVNPRWVENAANADLVLFLIIWKAIDANRPYSASAAGALHFGRVVSCHYGENLAVITNKALNGLDIKLVDRKLKRLLPHVLCRWYTLSYCDPLFKSLGGSC